MSVRFGEYLCWNAPLFPALILVAASCSANTSTFDPRDRNSPVRLVRTIELPNVHGRIDHMALSKRSDHLFVAELANGTVDDVDLQSGTLAGRISGLHEPQGVAWLPKQDEIAVACGDGTVEFYRASDRTEAAHIFLGDDADNVRVDARNGNLVVGYGKGGLAVIDPSTHRIVGKVMLPAHPEGFEVVGSRVFVNVPDAHKIIVADLDKGRVSSTMTTGPLFGNFPMALGAQGSRLAVAYRVPARLSVIDPHSLAAIFSDPICGDADDLYFRSAQLVVVCGSGAIELLGETTRDHRDRILTRSGARTALLDAARDRLFVAVPERKSPAAIWELSFR